MLPDTFKAMRGVQSWSPRSLGCVELPDRPMGNLGVGSNSLEGPVRLDFEPTTTVLFLIEVLSMIKTPSRRTLDNVGDQSTLLTPHQG
jgi:hypothetical protein